ncbi:transcription factor HES-3 isoform X1 [Microtus oregoni]|uniref:transcription factor HES-3 isoform X1 n=3 Tax=Microtus oregoni TaxID=111838 RepID=UPI001BB27BBF|nr:transcription factor HES-3 isoform X1 [Microtus oregoni]
MQTRYPYKGTTAYCLRRHHKMGTEPTSRGNPSGSASSFRKISKPLMEKKRRARINMSLEQLKSLLERHYSHQIRKRKLEKADILELSVKYMKSLQNSLQGLWPVPSGLDHPSGFQGCLPGVSQRLRHGEDGSGLRCPLVLERRAGSTMDSASPQAVSILRPCLPALWAPASAAGDSQSSLSPFPLPRGLPESSTGVPAPQPASNCQTENPRPGLGVWRPWDPGLAFRP